MGPRVRTRGDFEMTAMEQGIPGFNGAARSHARRSKTRSSAVAAMPSFNGAARSHARRYASALQGGTGAQRLQWGRAFARAEICMGNYP